MILCINNTWRRTATGRICIQNQSSAVCGFTDNLYEFGAGVGVLARGAKAMGLDWLTITDHSCDFDAVCENIMTEMCKKHDL